MLYEDEVPGSSSARLFEGPSMREQIEAARIERQRKDRNVKRALFLISGIGILGLVGLSSVGVVAYENSSRTVTAAINQVQCGASGNSGCTYMVYTSAGVFQDSDSVLAWKFNSSDVYNELATAAKDNETCTFTVRGWRVHITSQYPNILSVKDCEK